MITWTRIGVWCGVCMARTAIVVGGDGQEIRDCGSCGRRTNLRAEAQRRAIAAVTALRASDGRAA